MLVNLPHVLPPDSMGLAIAQLTNPSITPEELIVPPQLAEGVYLGHFNSINWPALRRLLKTEYPFMDDMRARMDKGERVDWTAVPPDFGVCDDYTQILERWPFLLTDERRFQIWMADVYREHQSPEGGWRWHKWGEYIGTYQPRHEYLYDEDIDKVQTFHIIEMNY